MPISESRLFFLFVSLVLGLLGPLMSWTAVKVLGEKNVNAKQKRYIYLLGGTSLLTFLVYGLFNNSFYDGYALNLIIFKINEPLLPSLVIFVPIIMTGLLIKTLRNFNWKKRLAVPLILGIIIASINGLQFFIEAIDQSPDTHLYSFVALTQLQ